MESKFSLQSLDWELSWQSACLVGTGPWAGAPAPYKPGAVVHTDNSSILRQQRQEVHSHLYRKFKVHLEYVRPSLKKCENLLVSIKVMLQEINYRCKCLYLKKDTSSLKRMCLLG